MITISIRSIIQSLYALTSNKRKTKKGETKKQLENVRVQSPIFTVNLYLFMMLIKV